MENTFTALDFETAQGKRWSICQVGMVRYENGIITNEIDLLVQPPENQHFWKNTVIHGISPEHTRNSPSFAKIWDEIEPLIHSQTVVAHNGAFDFSCLSQTLDLYNIPQPEYQQKCTYKIYGQDLSTLCHKHKIKLNHHDALSDARACGELYLMHLNKEYF